jgi:hypothetical protein
MSEFRFEPREHRYFLGPRELVGVTRSIKEYGLIDYSGIPQRILERAAVRGKAVHLALEYHDLGTLDENSLDTVVAGHLKAYKSFLSDSGFIVGSIEQARYHPTKWYAGRVDRPLGLLGGFPTILDFKSGEVFEEGHGAQLCGYAHLYGEPRRFRLIALRTFATGKYRVHEFFPSQFEYLSRRFFDAVAYSQQRIEEERCA